MVTKKLIATIEAPTEAELETVIDQLARSCCDVANSSESEETHVLLAYAPEPKGALRDALELGKAYIEDAIEDQETGLDEGIYEDHGLLKQRRADLAKIEAALAALAAPRHIGVTLEGGMVQDVFTDHASLVGVEAVVIDYDTDGADVVMLVPQNDGRLEEACVHRETLAIPPNEGPTLAKMSASLARNEVIELANGEHLNGINPPRSVTERHDGGAYCIVAEAEV